MMRFILHTLQIPVLSAPPEAFGRLLCCIAASRAGSQEVIHP